MRMFPLLLILLLVFANLVASSSSDTSSSSSSATTATTTTPSYSVIDGVSDEKLISFAKKNFGPSVASQSDAQILDNIRLKAKSSKEDLALLKRIVLLDSDDSKVDLEEEILPGIPNNQFLMFMRLGEMTNDKKLPKMSDKVLLELGKQRLQGLSEAELDDFRAAVKNAASRIRDKTKSKTRASPAADSIRDNVDPKDLRGINNDDGDSKVVGDSDEL